jgi:hypothetical protein
MTARKPKLDALTLRWCAARLLTKAAKDDEAANAYFHAYPVTAERLTARASGLRSFARLFSAEARRVERERER